MKEINNRMGITPLNKAEIDSFGEQIAGGNIYEFGSAILAVGGALGAMGVYLTAYGKTLPGASVINLLGRLFNGCTKGLVVALLNKVLAVNGPGMAHNAVYVDVLSNVENGYGLRESLNMANNP
jgi:hypothetical protein